MNNNFLEVTIKKAYMARKIHDITTIINLIAITKKNKELTKDDMDMLIELLFYFEMDVKSDFSSGRISPMELPAKLKRNILIYHNYAVHLRQLIHYSPQECLNVKKLVIAFINDINENNYFSSAEKRTLDRILFEIITRVNNAIKEEKSRAELEEKTSIGDTSEK